MKTLADETFEVLGLERDHPRQLIFAHKGRRLVGSVIIKGEDSASARRWWCGSIGPARSRAAWSTRTACRWRAPRSVADHQHRRRQPAARPGPRTRCGPTARPITTGADGRFRIDGLKPGVKTFHDVTFKDRPGYWGDTGKAFRDIAIQKPGEIRDLGDIKVKVARQ